jgi:hypothetical protein
MKGFLLNRNYRPFIEARNFVHKLRLKTISEWRQYCKSGKKPKDIPSNVDAAIPYKEDWKGWGDWLGTGTIARQNMQYRTFEEARDYVHALGFTNKEEWSKYCKSGKKPKDIPSVPREPYENEWLG